MTIPEVQQARDYNQGLPAPIRWAHMGAAAVGVVFRPVRVWTEAPRRRAWAGPIVWGLACAAVVGLFDGVLTRGIRGTVVWRPDLSRAPMIMVIAGTVVAAARLWWRGSAKRLGVLNWLAGLLVTLVVCRVVSMVVGRPLPRFDDPGYFINPLGSYPLGPGRGIRHAWEFWADGVWQLWSMPAVQSGYAAVGAAVVMAMYPRLRTFAWLAIAAVAAAMVVTGEGYASDTVVGAALGLASGRMAMERGWGRVPGWRKLVGEAD